MGVPSWKCYNWLADITHNFCTNLIRCLFPSLKSCLMNRDFLCERRIILGQTQISVQIMLGAYNHRILGHRPATPSMRANYTNYPAGCILCIFLSLFTLPSIRGCAAVVSQWQAAQAAPRCVGVSSRTHGEQNRHYAGKRGRPWAIGGWSSVMGWRTSR